MTRVLTERETEVALLIAAGRSDLEIARELVISRRTVQTHVKHILCRLGLRNRVQVAAHVATLLVLAQWVGA